MVWGGTAGWGSSSHGFPCNCPFWFTYNDVEPNYASGMTPPREYYLCIRAASPPEAYKTFPNAQFKAEIIVNGKLRKIFFKPFGISKNWVRSEEEHYDNYPDWEKNPHLSAAVKITGRVKPNSGVKFYFRENRNSPWLEGTQGPTISDVCHTKYKCNECNGYGNPEPIGFCKDVGVSRLCEHTEDPDWC